MEREKTEKAVQTAAEKWEKAPGHIKIMAGPYVDPLLSAIKAINQELEVLQSDLIKGVV